MRKLGCFGSIIAALLVSAGTARADPFTVSPDTPSARGIDNAWFNNLIKLNGPTNGATKTYLSDSIIIFGGDIVVAPSAAITLTSHGAVQTGLDEALLLSGAVNTLSLSQTRPTSESAKDNDRHGGPSTSVPGAGAAFDPLTPSLPGLGMIPATGTGNGDPVVANAVTALLVVPGLSTLTLPPNASATAAAATAMALTSGAPGFAAPAGTSLPATPEPSPLFLLAGGLALALLMQRYSLRVKRG